MIKLIVSDIDGTLLPDGEHDLNPELHETILKLREKGMQFVAASGRQWVSIERVFDPIKEKIFYVSNNGAYIGCHGRNLVLNDIAPELVRNMVSDIRKAGLIPLLSGPDVLYLDSQDARLHQWLVEGYQFQVEMVDDLLEVQDRIIQVTAYRQRDVEAATVELRKNYGDVMQISIAGDNWMDCMAKGVNKGAAVRHLQECLGITPQETMAFGDQMNDIEMMNAAYYSFAVGNARAEMKEAARFQADTNVNDGVLKILKLLV